MKYRVIDTPWHVVHAYRLFSIPDVEWWHLSGVNRRVWNYEHRPLGGNFKGYVGIKEFDPSQFDVAVMHLDNWCDGLNMRAFPYRVLSALAKGLPQIVINHGAPDDGENAARIRKMLGDDGKVLLCNSFKAREQWGYEPSRTIIHGYRVDDFGPPTYERDEIITICSGGELSREYHGIPIFERMRAYFPITWLGHDVKCKSYEEYREYLRGGLIYFNPTQWSPMPGARTEAMLSGLCVVTTAFQDEERFFEHGVTGFLCNTFKEQAETIAMLLSDPEKAKKVGQQGREVARESFAQERFWEEWQDLLEEVSK